MTDEQRFERIERLMKLLEEQLDALSSGLRQACERSSAGEQEGGAIDAPRSEAVDKRRS